ncbi:uncharacterized protein LOC144439076 [Glandiceps talaboti]
MIALTSKNTFHFITFMLVVLNLNLSATTSVASHFGRQRRGHQLARMTDDVTDKITKANTLHEALRILYPSRDINDILEHLFVRKSVDEPMIYMISRARLSRTREAVSTSQWKAEQEDFQELAEEKKKTKCGAPVNVVIQSSEAFNISERNGVIIWPSCVVLPRCEKTSGCCPNGSCVGKHGSQQKVTKKIFISNFYTGEEYIEERDIEVFSQCECGSPGSNVNVADLKHCGNLKVWSNFRHRCECRRPCPLPYEQDPTSCECSCSRSNRQCRKVKRGRMELSEDACQCVRTENCSLPTCQKRGIFSIPECTCVKKSVH